MATSYSGLYQYPIGDGISFIFMLFETTHSSTESNYSNLIADEIRSLQLSSVQGSVLVCRHERTFFYCTDTFYSTETQLYTLPRSANPQIDGYCVNTIDSTSGAYNFFAAPGSAYYSGCFLKGFVKTSDNHYCNVSILCTAHNAEQGLLVGLQPPSQSSPGFMLWDMAPSTISVGTWNYNAILSRLSNYLSNNPPKPWVEHTDPYAPGGTSETGGGGMTGDTPPYTDIDFPTLPSISATNAGMVSIWVPTLSELQRFAAYLWNTNILTSGFWKNLVSSPIDLFYGLSIMPVPIDRQQVHTDTITFGWIDTEIMWDYIDEQYVEFDCGTLDMDEYWKAYLDYAPYTKIDIYLPYIGVKHLNTNDLMDKTLSLKYVIDLGSGACVAMIKSDDSVLYHFAGNCATPIPVSSIQFQEIVRNITSTAVSAVGGILGAAVSPALGVGGLAGAINGAIKTFTTDHATVNRSGAMGSSSGLMGVQTPYLIITRPRMAIPEDQNTYTGYPSFITEQIGDLEGYTEIEIIHMHDLTCTSEEFTEIEDLLLKGVII